ncbi:3-methylfumaryl-CoA hydratase [Roseovarius azorensis]|uniref:3-methylfumaryl-CoA hydratase n=1 Tax=Roseovarius azorensis TaxID=1287727 RepID=A0A1H7WR34_9RHOB|nr:MaoC family dehydratase N-terminal domain-containing protein [Roseovarius azorensis]SEM24030.1 3-methylfumaryl-CoA hydratase [Roseovarius azorensis]
MDWLNIASWIGRSETQVSCISVQQAAQIHATLGTAQMPPPGQGDPMPPLWHWCAFVPTVPTDDLARDGHPRLGGFLPPVPLQRRMWASASLRFLRPLHVGERLTRHSTIRNLQEKAGASGPLVLVTLAHELHGEDGLAIEEEQNIVYLDIPATFSPPRKQSMPETPLLHDTRTASEVLLFRYSALTFNAHRIHIDLSYAQQVERYPGLVVHGPLQATWLMQLAHKVRGRWPTGFDFRGVHPMLLVSGESPQIDLMATGGEGGALTLFAGQAGHQCTQAKATWEGKQ